MIRYDNTPTVVVVLVPLRGGLLMIRRALAGEGYGKLALPGGYQMLGQTWQEAAAREALEETGVVIFPEALRVVTVETTPDRRQNLLFCQSPPVKHGVHSPTMLKFPKCWSSMSQSKRPFRCTPAWFESSSKTPASSNGLRSRMVQTDLQERPMPCYSFLHV
jgi:hypothetical protein